MSAIATDEGNPTMRAPGDDGLRLTAREWLLLAVLAAVQFNHIVDFMIIMPLGPVYNREMGVSMGQFGWVVAAYTISAAIANLVAAFFIDRFDRKRALLTCFTGFTAGTALCAVAPDYPLLLAARIVAGAFGGVAASLVMAIIGDVFSYARRGKATSVVMSAFSVAASAGLPLGLLCARTAGWHAPFALLAALSAAVLIFGIVVLPPLRGHLQHAAGPAPSARDRVGELYHLLIDANHRRAFALMITMMLTSFLVGPYIPTFLVQNVGLNEDNLMYIYLVGGLATILTTTPTGWLADRYGKLPLYRATALLTMIPVVLITVLPPGTGLWLVLAVTTGQMITMSARMVPAMAMITASAVPAERGSFMSLNTAIQHMTAGLAAALRRRAAGAAGQGRPDRPLSDAWPAVVHRDGRQPVCRRPAAPCGRGRRRCRCTG